MGQVLGMQSQPEERRPSLERPSGPRDSRRAPGSNRGARAPAHRRRRDLLIRRKEPHGPLVLAEAEPGVPDRTVALLAGEPRRRHEPHRPEPERAEAGEPPGDPLAGGRRVEGEKLTFTRRAAPRAQAVAYRPREPRLIMPFTVEDDLGAF